MNDDKTIEPTPMMQYPQPRSAPQREDLSSSSAKPGAESDPALAVACSHCDKGVGDQCTSSSGNPADTHKVRIEAYEATLSDAE